MNPEGVMKEIVGHIESKLNDIGLMFRIFFRTKSQDSIRKKLASNPKYGSEKKLQDIIGIRVVLYFNDDIDIVRKVVSSEYSERPTDVSIDDCKNDEFKASRYNIVYSISDKQERILNLNNRDKSIIDTTFELQIRTVFSEGWHEVEHDLRYKCQLDWNGFDCYSRRLNGVYASLETSEWTMIKIFDDLAYNHYKNADWSAMLRQKFRLRFIPPLLINESILELFKDNNLAKKFFRLDRSELIMDMSSKGFYYPITFDNLIYFANLTKIKNDNILELTPSIMIEDMSS